MATGLWRLIWILHDLAILQSRALAHAQFPALAVASVEKDDGRSKNATAFSGLPMAEKFQQMLHCLNTGPEYPREYERFVKGVSYAKDGTTPDFAQAFAGRARFGSGCG
jgi:hypothetical protein